MITQLTHQLNNYIQENDQFPSSPSPHDSPKFVRQLQRSLVQMMIRLQAENHVGIADERIRLRSRYLIRQLRFVTVLMIKVQQGENRDGQQCR